MCERKSVFFPILITIASVSSLAIAEPVNNRHDRQRHNRNALLEQADQNAATPNLSPSRHISRDPLVIQSSTATPNQDFRSLDGSGNNQTDPLMDSANSQLMRLITPQYGDDGVNLSIMILI